MNKLINKLLKYLGLIRLREFLEYAIPTERKLAEQRNNIYMLQGKNNHKDFLIKRTPEYIRNEAHYDHLIKKVSLGGLSDSIAFTTVDTKGLNCFYPPKHIDCDICCNLPMIFKPNSIFSSLEDLIENGIKYTFPIESYEIKNGFLNVKTPRELKIYSMTKAVANIA